MSPVSASMAPSWRVSRSESACYYISNMSDRLAIQPLVDALLADNREVLDRHMTERGASLVDLVWQPDATLCRSEEHTSELQSLMRISYAVFCLKKKK